MKAKEYIPEMIVCSDLPCGYPKVGQECPYQDKRACPIYVTAQISFKAGQESIGDYPDQIYQAEKRGRKEVVEWMRMHCSIIDSKRILSENTWQAKLKSWNISY